VRRILVVGASAAGLAAAETLRREGYDGTLTLVGEEAHLPYDRPPLSKQILSGEWSPERLPLRARACVWGAPLAASTSPGARCCWPTGRGCRTTA
jgi:NADPH-dependent 2,4-dienoyl-CoA reductase/sulfur reductase-like enzyme